jgi:hypothetical protein
MDQATFDRLRSQVGAWHTSLLVAAAVAGAAALGAAAYASDQSRSVDTGPTPSSSGPFGASPASLPYDREYPAIHYERTPRDNGIARLQARLDQGEVKLEFHPPRGYLDSLLAALSIDRSSQTLVYSKTSLQVGRIDAATPRAIYFNEDTYVAWVQGGENIEMGAMDAQLGQVFYVLPNQAGVAPHLKRLTLDCLACHDTYELSGGGVPRFLLMSTYVDTQGNQLTHEGQIITSDQTELKYRWGGWYVTGQSGDQVHLGNILVHNVEELVHLDQVRRGNLETLDGLFDTRPYLTDKSDIVALLVLQHQVDVQNIITRVNFEVRSALAKDKGRQPSAKTKAQLKPFMDELADSMLFVDAVHFTSKITGNSGFDRWFEARGPRDRLGRSLRDLDLKTRLFKYPLSYLIYSASFDALPDYAKSYVYGRFIEALSAGDTRPAHSQLTPDERTATLEILTATKPDFARRIAARGGT